ncbi:crossover junction endodeoxyribonuclease RuvC [Bacteroidetes/Chlorobi group bacterium Naka2016]|jgi:crossover junction endodeoxyribonuclease RuvC|nr:MAG: crossover junction endodeoxyribonuclease RuvC [Bacteroidetes/Chlorobi group bacterium Naka2016]
MTIIGIDPGSISCGYGIIEISQDGFFVIEFGLIKPNEKSQNFNFIDRLKNLYDNITSILTRYKVIETAIETQFYHKNAQSLMKLTQARTSIELASLNLNIPVFEYSPREVKLSVTGNGNASKKSVSYMVSSILQIDLQNHKFDVSDALAVALCHISRKGNILKRNSPRNWREFVALNPDKIINP